MSLRRLAVLSVHTSPLAQPGSGDGGGMNVYVRSLASSLARAGVACDVFTRRDHPGEPRIVEVEPGFRVVHLDAGPPESVPKHDLVDLVEPMVGATLEHIRSEELGYDALHADYWISGAVGHRLKHELDLPLAATFHTLARVKADAGVDDDPEQRARVEQETVNCCDLILASTEGERAQFAELYQADRERIEIVPPGVDHDVFSSASPAQRVRERAALGLGDGPALLFAGRLQPLKGAGLAVRTLAELGDPTAVLLIVGGPSGTEGEAELRRIHALVRTLGLTDQVRFVPPQPHERLAHFYRAVDVCLVPSRSESFGLVALEAAACGTPVIAAAVGGLRSLIDDGRTGFLVEGREPADFASLVALLIDDPELTASMGAQAEAASRGYAWSITAARLRRLYADLLSRDPRLVSLTPTEHDVAAARELIDEHLFGPVRAEDAVQHVEYDPELRRWYVRFGCDGRDAATIYFDLHQRTLRYEVYFIPAPPQPDRLSELHAFALRCNHGLYGARFSTGPDGDLYLTGRLALEHLTEEELDRIVGVLFETTERWFQQAVAIVFKPRS